MSQRGFRGGRSRGRGESDRGGSVPREGAPRGGRPTEGGGRGGERGGGSGFRGAQGPPGGGQRGGPPRGGGYRGGRGEVSRGAYGGEGARGGGYRGGHRGGFRGRGRGGPPQIFAAGVPPRIDYRLIEDAERVVARYAQQPTPPYDPEQPLPASRPGFGKMGKPVVLRANFFAVTLPRAPIFEYRVDIEPKKNIASLRPRIFQLVEADPQFARHLRYISHDQNERLVSAQQLPQPLAISVILKEGGTPQEPLHSSTYTVSIVYQSQLDVNGLHRYLSGDPTERQNNPAPVLSALNLVLQQHAQREGFRVGLNRYFFTATEQERLRLSHGVEAWKGFYSSIRPTFGQLTVNVNVCMSAFYVKGNLADAIMSFQRQSKGGLPKRFTQKLRIRTKHLGHKRNVQRILDTDARKTRFYDNEVKRQVTVEEYFKRKYPNIHLQYAGSLPIVDVGSKKPTYIPAELCDIIEGTPYLGRLDRNEASQMITYACQPPETNARSITEDGFTKLGLNPVGDQSPMAAFGISVSTDMISIPGRILPPPALSYKSGKLNVRDGGWNILDVKFHRGASLFPHWAVLVVRDGSNCALSSGNNDDPILTRLIEEFSAKLKKVGINVPNASPRVVWTEWLPHPDQDPGRKAALEILEKTMSARFDPNNKPSFVLVLLSLEDNYIYPGLKRLGDVVLGIQTVCMILNQKKALVLEPKKRDQYYSNIALKVNTKLGGNNHLLDPDGMKWLREKKTMMVGCDVTHPSPSSAIGTPSIAAMVASVDDDFVQFPASMRLQDFDKSKEAREMIDRMKDMMVERLRLYHKVNRKLPERVFIFRDGVSEGQFELVLKHELPRVDQAFAEVYGNSPRPKLSIIICGKRHHARFFPTSEDTMSNNGNTKPGTVVDKGITDVYGFDFYLQAHLGLQGTVRPTHYTVIYDENKFTADTIQQGTHTASYSYARATKAVSLIPAAYYADLACDRGRFYINEYLNLGSEDRASSAGTKVSKDEERKRNYEQARQRWGQGVHEALRETMFYI